MKDTRDQIKLV